eukprot:CAMPEP_0201517764 /NCGR_PEP_ID=MMETSP0161_2-20130828/8802_1 /ASSEMBLY_ACC=CAM_ASM_000251 /TAXON_ID=180227 /ORGANISM="Neoparamoeba aestuarina, Strain SoJaBio B1-5/56/2" /LENGTH=283 /DNA_ID=CAMNT_0047915375 /DNA_START=30 /DNA_END=881 /DNA_ORIENTATION=+
MRMLLFLFFFTLLCPPSFVLGKVNPLKDPPDPILYAVVECSTTVDPSQKIVIEVYSNWSPLGAKRFVELVKDGYYDQSPIFRVAKRGRNWGYLTQFGISLNKDLEEKWGSSTIPDDPSLGFSFDRGDISFAGNGPNSRTTQVFIPYGDTTSRGLGNAPWETPFGKVVVGMNIADEFYDGDGKISLDIPPFGQGPDPHKIKTQGRPYLRKNFPELTYIEECVVSEDFTHEHPIRENKKSGLPLFRAESRGYDDNDEWPLDREERKRKREERRREREKRSRDRWD